MTIKLSVVDQTPVHGCHTKKDAPSLTVELARLCDEQGYHRYWVAVSALKSAPFFQPLTAAH